MWTLDLAVEWYEGRVGGSYGARPHRRRSRDLYNVLTTFQLGYTNVAARERRILTTREDDALGLELQLRRLHATTKSGY